MKEYRRYAVYYTPKGDLEAFGSAWLGWDLAGGVEVAHPQVAALDVEALTRRPRRYGLHATIKPPFRLSAEKEVDALAEAVRALCAQLSPVVLDGLHLRALGSFLALVPAGDVTRLNELAAQVVSGLDDFRAPPEQAELERRREAGLSEAQERNLVNWGYPYVMDAFRFHITLTGPVGSGRDDLTRTLQSSFAPHLPHPFVIDDLTLVGEDAGGRFHEISRFPLGETRGR